MSLPITFFGEHQLIVCFNCEEVELVSSCVLKLCPGLFVLEKGGVTGAFYFSFIFPDFEALMKMGPGLMNLWRYLGFFILAPGLYSQTHLRSSDK